MAEAEVEVAEAELVAVEGELVEAVAEAVIAGEASEDEDPAAG